VAPLGPVSGPEGLLSSRLLVTRTAKPGASMLTSTFKQTLSTVDELTITVTGCRSRREISLPVCFVQEGQTLHLVPVKCSDSEWYKNVLHNPAFRVAAKRATITAAAKPVTEATKVRRIVEPFRAKYGAAEVKKYFAKFDVGVDARPAFATRSDPSGLQPDAKRRAARA
jgi:deazaflavin-dependent oxidoreductase (nitroreductase family)